MRFPFSFSPANGFDFGGIGIGGRSDGRGDHDTVQNPSWFADQQARDRRVEDILVRIRDHLTLYTLKLGGIHTWLYSTDSDSTGSEMADADSGAGAGADAGAGSTDAPSTAGSLVESIVCPTVVSTLSSSSDTQTQTQTPPLARRKSLPEIYEQAAKLKAYEKDRLELWVRFHLEVIDSARSHVMSSTSIFSIDTLEKLEELVDYGSVAVHPLSGRAERLVEECDALTDTLFDLYEAVAPALGLEDLFYFPLIAVGR